MSEDLKKTDLPAWRTVGVPIVVTFAAIVFWLEYYGAVGWWPVILFVIWAGNYAKYSVMKPREDGKL